MEHTANSETSDAMQNLLRSQHKKKELDDATYKKVRPVGATHPRMYGVPKVYNRTHHYDQYSRCELTPTYNGQMVADIAQTCQRFRKVQCITIKDSFTFADAEKKVSVPKGAHISSFDIKSLFTNVPLDETVDICVQELPFRP